MNRAFFIIKAIFLRKWVYMGGVPDQLLPLSLKAALLKKTGKHVRMAVIVNNLSALMLPETRFY